MRDVTIGSVTGTLALPHDPDEVLSLSQAAPQPEDGSHMACKAWWVHALWQGDKPWPEVDGAEAQGRACSTYLHAEAGATIRAINAAAAVAVGLVNEAYGLDADDIEEKSDFSEAPGDGSTSD